MQAQRKRKRLGGPLVQAIGHPLRAQILTILAERVASPVQIARELNRDVTNVGYHVSTLAEVDLIEEVDQRPVRGTIEHFYRAVELPVVTKEQEKERDAVARRSFAETTIGIFAANATHALEVGTLTRRGDHHLTRHAFNVDEQGWKDLTQAYMQLFERVYDIQEESAQRPLGKGERPMRVVSFLSLFEMPPAEAD